MKKISTEFLILGGGWSGLLAAYFLSRKAGDVVVLEKEETIGGLARTFDFEGFKFDIGGHRIYFRDQKNLEFLKDIFPPADLLHLKRTSKLFFNGKYINYPITPSSLFNVDKKHLINVLLDLFRKKAQEDNGTFESWAKDHYGQTLYEIFFRVYTEKVWGIGCNELSSAWADKRIGKNRLSNFLRNILILDEEALKESAPFFYYPRRGVGSLIDALWEKARQNCLLYKNIQLGRMTAQGKALSSAHFISNGESYEVDFKYVFSSIPLTGILKSAFGSQGTFPADEVLRYRDLVLVSLLLEKEEITKWHWCYVPSKEVIFSRLHEPKFWSKNMSSGSGKTLLCAEIFCNKNDNYWNMGDGELVSRVQQGLIQMGLIDKKCVLLGSCIKRIGCAYPLHYRGFEKSLMEARRALEEFENLRLIGRSGTHSYYEMEECLTNTRRIVKEFSLSRRTYPQCRNLDG